jgi:hypothetical protein
MMPLRIQLSRAKGWRMPANTVKVDRTTRWGNPYSADAPVDMRQVRRWGWIFGPGGREACGTDGLAVRKFAVCVGFDHAIHPFVRQELGGKNLACWCKPGAHCHADVLLVLANPSTWDGE